MATRITATELARNLSDILNRVKYRGEEFEVVRKGEVLAVLKPDRGAKLFTVGEFRRRFGDRKVPEGLADAIEDGREALGPLPDPPPW
jgi:prevent-host-death family protein